MDAGDDAVFKEERQMALLLKHRKSKPINYANPDQRCWQCGAVTDSQSHRWCSNYCRDEWAEENEG